MKKTLFIGALFCISLVSVNAAVVFSGTNGDLDFNAPSGSFTLGEITVTLAANSGSVVNATASGGLGVNSPTGVDDSDGLDTLIMGVNETLTFSFDVDVTLNSISYANAGDNDGLALSFNGVVGPDLAPNTFGEVIYDTVLLAGETLVITATAPNGPDEQNNGVSITQFTVTAIPEPSSVALIGLAGIAAIFRRRKLV